MAEKPKIFVKFNGVEAGSGEINDVNRFAGMGSIISRKIPKQTPRRSESSWSSDELVVNDEDEDDEDDEDEDEDSFEDDEDEDDDSFEDDEDDDSFEDDKEEEIEGVVEWVESC